MIDQEALSAVVPADVSLRLVEPQIYSLYPPGENTNPYDERFGTIYDVVACNRFYNRLVWGYWTGDYHSMCLDALRSSTDGWVLDAGCGSLAFTARTYLDYHQRPVVLLDQSIKLLRLAKSRLVRLGGKVPANVVLLHGDALRLPLKPKSFGTIISLNLLHVVDDVKRVLQGLRNVLQEGGTITLTTLVRNNRLADRYLHMLGKAGKLVPREMDQLRAVFDGLGMPIEYRIQGNLAFISCTWAGPVLEERQPRTC